MPDQSFITIQSFILHVAVQRRVSDQHSYFVSLGVVVQQIEMIYEYYSVLMLWPRMFYDNLMRYEENSMTHSNKMLIEKFKSVSLSSCVLLRIKPTANFDCYCKQAIPVR